MTDITVGIIGGSGLYAMEGLRVLHERSVETPFGDPSDPYVIGEIDGVGVAFLARHGRGHRFTPSEVNYRANIYGMKVLGVHTIPSTARAIARTRSSATASSDTCPSRIPFAPRSRSS
jgi:5'-methylthioadenosine phosphorylase